MIITSKNIIENKDLLIEIDKRFKNKETIISKNKLEDGSLEVIFGNSDIGQYYLKDNINNVELALSYHDNYSSQILFINKNILVSDIVKKIFTDINKRYSVSEHVNCVVLLEKKHNQKWEHIDTFDCLTEIDNNITLKDALTFIILCINYYSDYENNSFEIKESNYHDIMKLKDIDIYDIFTNYMTLPIADFKCSLYSNMYKLQLFGTTILEVPEIYFYQKKSDLKILYQLYHRSK